jgi:hypothetical protein
MTPSGGWATGGSRRVGRPQVFVAALLLPLVLTSCAKIHHYEARPLLVCPSQPVNLRWRVSGSAMLSAEPFMLDLGSVRDKGEKTVRIERSTTFILKVRSWFGRPVLNRQEVTVVDSGETQTIGETTSCGRGEVIAEIERDESELGALLRVSTVTLLDGLEREVVVEHDGKAVTLRPDVPTSEVLRGTAPGGRWTLRSRLRDGELCGEVSDMSPPEILAIDVQLECVPQ